jgi:hypothetical protein
LQPDAIDRYARFNKFVADETRRNAEAAKARVSELWLSMDSLQVIATEAADIKADLDRESAGGFVAVEAFAKAVDARINHAQRCLTNGTWTDAPELSPSPCAELIALADMLNKRASDELAAADPEKARVLATECNELTDRKWLKDTKDEVKAQIARHAHAARLKNCQEDCTTNAITIKSGELHEAHVTTAFCKAFEEELVALGMNTLPVKLDATKGSKGERRFGDIASEGEHRCIALAAFMAELSQASHKSALVFDDPVSSLDHKRRNAIAARLVKEAAQRQVIVFTHDLAFVCDLDAAARSATAHIHYQHIERLAGEPGRVLPGRPWDAQTFKGQMKTLNEQIGRADNVYKTKGESEYREAAMPIVGRLRGACERIIEQHMLHGVIKRHDSRIDVKNTPSLAAVTAEQWKAVHAIWKDCSNIIEAHATPLSGPANLPTPDELKRWMQGLENTVEAVKRTRAACGGALTTEPKPAPAVVSHG